MKRRVITTADGSRTLEIVELEDTYHSRHGALQESEYVFAEKGLNHRIDSKKEISVLEIGFGTGLNALVTRKAIVDKNVVVQYTSLETFPVPKEEVIQLEYTELELSLSEFYLSLHEAEWNKEVQLDESFVLLKRHVALEEFNTVKQFDVVYFDAFGPASQPELWSNDILRKVFHLTAPGGVFVTYCAKGQVRRDLTDVGYTVERLPGPPGKRHMLRGTKKWT